MKNKIIKKMSLILLIVLCGCGGYEDTPCDRLWDQRDNLIYNRSSPALVTQTDSMIVKCGCLTTTHK